MVFRALFWRFDDEDFDQNLHAATERYQNSLQNAQKRSQSEEDLELVRQAIYHQCVTLT